MRYQSSTGSGQTVEALFEQHSEKLFTYLCQHTASREDAEDVLVDTLQWLDSQVLKRHGKSRAFRRGAHQAYVHLFMRRKVCLSEQLVGDAVQRVFNLDHLILSFQAQPE